MSIDRKKINERLKRRRVYLRKIAIEKYGGKCTCCGESEKIFLCIDHINGGGRRHRKLMTFSNIDEWLRSKGYPEGFRILCYNCNNAYRWGKCPHNK